MKTDKLKKVMEPLLKNKYVLILLAVGLILLLFTSGNDKKTVETNIATGLTETGFSVDELENRLADALSSIQGAGKVQVVLTVKSSTEQVVAEDRDSSERITADGSDTENSVKTVLIDSGSSESPVTLKYIYPEFQGALIIAQGADDASVRLALTEAVSSLTDIGSDRITVTKMQG